MILYYILKLRALGTFETIWYKSRENITIDLQDSWLKAAPPIFNHMFSCLQ